MGLQDVETTKLTKGLLWQLDKKFVSLLCVGYLFALMDRSNLGKCLTAPHAIATHTDSPHLFLLLKKLFLFTLYGRSTTPYRSHFAGAVKQPLSDALGLDEEGYALASGIFFVFYLVGDNLYIFAAVSLSHSLTGTTTTATATRAFPICTRTRLLGQMLVRC